MISLLKYLLIPKQGFSDQEKKEMKINLLGKRFSQPYPLVNMLNSHNYYWWMAFQIIHEGEITEGFFQVDYAMLVLYSLSWFQTPVWRISGS